MFAFDSLVVSILLQSGLALKTDVEEIGSPRIKVMNVLILSKQLYPLG